MYDEEGNPIVSDLFSIETWQKHCLGPFSKFNKEKKKKKKKKDEQKKKTDTKEKEEKKKEKKAKTDNNNNNNKDLTTDVDSPAVEEKLPLPVLSVEKMAHLRMCLNQCKSFREQYLRYRPDVKYPPMANLLGVGRPCPASMIRNGPKSVKGWDLKSYFMPEGDFRVSMWHAMMPPGFDVGLHYQLFTTKREHMELLNGKKVRVIIERLIEMEAAINKADSNDDDADSNPNSTAPIDEETDAAAVTLQVDNKQLIKSAL